MIVYAENPKESTKKVLELVAVMQDHKTKDQYIKINFNLYTSSLLTRDFYFHWKLK